MSNNSIDDTDLLYLRVRNIEDVPHRGNHDYRIEEDGKITIMPTAFRDPNFQTSVDIARINSYDANKTKNGDKPEYIKTNGVIGITAGDINSIKPFEGMGNRKVEVKPDPLPENDAHAKIVADPDFLDCKNPLNGEKISPSQRSTQFRKLRIKEADLATDYIRENGWIIEPVSSNVDNSD